MAIGSDAGDRAAAEAKGPRMDLSAYIFDALDEDAVVGPLPGPRASRCGTAVISLIHSRGGVAVTFPHASAAVLALASRSAILPVAILSKVS